MDAVGRAELLSPHSSRPNILSSVSLDPFHVAQARQQSSDNGATLTFSRMNLSYVGTLAMEELATARSESSEDESPIKRMAFDNNRLSTLPRDFPVLHHLRYLNLKHNNFSVFPDVLTLMPSLDTLDISHNKIKRLPAQAGYLVDLRVFSLSRNRITSLPPYLSQFRNLEVLQVSRNPIEWPPRSVMAKADQFNSKHSMKDWIHILQQWMEADYSGDSEHNPDSYIETDHRAWRFPSSSMSEQNLIPHNRSFSMDSSFSMLSASETSKGNAAPSSITHDANNQTLPLHLGILGSSSSENSPTRSIESYPPSPVDSEFFSDKLSANLDPTESQLHNRNASDGGGLHLAVHHSLSGHKKKSMPDLRTAKLNFTKKKDSIPVTPSRALPTQRSEEVAATSPQRQDSDSSFNSNRATGSVTRGANGALSSMALERYSYFERLSRRPTSVALPESLMCLVESARTILFAMCQVYQTLEHYMVHAVDDRICSVLRKVVDPASADIIQLINSLDRFDAMSQKTLPSPAICRNVVESCRDSVAVFGKAVGVLGLQLKLIVAGDDVRYSRWIMLELYGATAEVSSAWHMMVPYIEAIKPMLRSKAFPPHPLPSGNISGSENYNPPTSSLPIQPDLVQPPRPNGPPVGTGRVRTTRRHAGSFSSKDVEIGKTLPSYDHIPQTFGGVVSGLAKDIPTPRVPKRQATTIPTTTISSPTPTTPVSFDSFTSAAYLGVSRPGHSREGSQASLQRSTSSLSTPFNTNHVESSSNSKFVVDQEALQAVQDAVEVAPAVWDMIDELFSDTLDGIPPISETIDEARRLTKKLSQTLQLLHESEGLIDRKELREDAHAFLKMVVQLSNVIKTYRGPHAVSSSLRTSMVKLTNSTEEFAILLHVSSYTSSTPRPYTPLLSISTSSLAPEELRIGSSLSRSKSAQPSGSFKLPLLAQDSPRSALPSKSFKAPRIKYSQSREGAVLDPG